VFRRHDGYVVALTYGSHADWVKNVLAAGECDLITRRQCHHLINPTLSVDPDERIAIPQPFRMILTATNVTRVPLSAICTVLLQISTIRSWRSGATARMLSRFDVTTTA
jgi:hypothetical protein